jgi:hypothetical protein
MDNNANEDQADPRVIHVSLEEYREQTARRRGDIDPDTTDPIERARLDRRASRRTPY